LEEAVVEEETEVVEVEETVDEVAPETKEIIPIPEAEVSIAEAKETATTTTEETSLTTLQSPAAVTLAALMAPLAPFRPAADALVDVLQNIDPLSVFLAGIFTAATMATFKLVSLIKEENEKQLKKFEESNIKAAMVVVKELDELEDVPVSYEDMKTAAPDSKTMAMFGALRETFTTDGLVDDNINMGVITMGAEDLANNPTLEYAEELLKEAGVAEEELTETAKRVLNFAKNYEEGFGEEIIIDEQQPTQSQLSPEQETTPIIATPIIDTGTLENKVLSQRKVRKLFGLKKKDPLPHNMKGEFLTLYSFGIKKVKLKIDEVEKEYAVKDDDKVVPPEIYSRIVLETLVEEIGDFKIKTPGAIIYKAKDLTRKPKDGDEFVLVTEFVDGVQSKEKMTSLDLEQKADLALYTLLSGNWDLRTRNVFFNNNPGDPNLYVIDHEAEKIGSENSVLHPEGKFWNSASWPHYLSTASKEENNALLEKVLEKLQNEGFMNNVAEKIRKKIKKNGIKKLADDNHKFPEIFENNLQTAEDTIIAQIKWMNDEIDGMHAEAGE